MHACRELKYIIRIIGSIKTVFVFVFVGIVSQTAFANNSNFDKFWLQPDNLGLENRTVSSTVTSSTADVAAMGASMDDVISRSLSNPALPITVIRARVDAAITKNNAQMAAGTATMPAWHKQLFPIFQKAGIQRIWLNLRYIMIMLATLLLTLTFFNQMRNGKLEFMDLLFRCGMFVIVWGGADAIFYYGSNLQQDLGGAMASLGGPVQNWEASVRTEQVFADARKAVIQSVITWVATTGNREFNDHKIDARKRPVSPTDGSKPQLPDPKDATYYQNGASRMDLIDLSDVMLDLVYSGTAVGPTTIVNSEADGDATISAASKSATDDVLPKMELNYANAAIIGMSGGAYYAAGMIPLTTPVQKKINATIKALEAINYGVPVSAADASAAPKVTSPNTYAPVVSYASYAANNTAINSIPVATPNPGQMNSKMQQLALALNASFNYQASMGVAMTTTTPAGGQPQNVFSLTPNGHLAELYVNRLKDLNGVLAPKEDEEFYKEVKQAHIEALAAMGIIPKSLTLISTPGTATKDKLTLKLGTYTAGKMEAGSATPNAPTLQGDATWISSAADVSTAINPNGNGPVDRAMNTDSPGWLVSQITKLFTVINRAVNSMIIMLFTFFYRILFQIQFFILMLTTPFIFSDKLEGAFKGQVKALLYMVITPAIGGLALGMWTSFMAALISGSLTSVIGAAGGAGVLVFAGLLQSMSAGAVFMFILMNLVGSFMIATKIRGWTEKVISGASIAGDVLKTGATAIASGVIGGSSLGAAMFKHAGAGGMGNIASSMSSMSDKGHSIMESAVNMANDPSKLGRGRSQIPNVAGNDTANKNAADERRAVGSTASNDASLQSAMSGLPVDQQIKASKQIDALRRSPQYEKSSEQQKQEAVTQVLKNAKVKDAQALGSRIGSADHSDSSHNNAIATDEERAVNERAFKSSGQLRHTAAAKAALEAQAADPSADKKTRTASIETSLLAQGMPSREAQKLAATYADHKPGDASRQTASSAFFDLRRANTALVTGNMSMEDYKQTAGVKMVGNAFNKTENVVTEALQHTRILHRKTTDVHGRDHYEPRGFVHAASNVARQTSSGIAQLIQHDSIQSVSGGLSPNINLSHLAQSLSLAGRVAAVGIENAHTVFQKSQRKG